MSITGELTSGVAYGLMMKHDLMISDLIEHAATVHSGREIYTLNSDMSEHRYTWSDCAKRVRKLANALVAAGIKEGDRVATIAWNNYQHIEIYYAVSSIGAIVHTINPRLKPAQIGWMVNHAEDTFLIFDNTFGPIIDGVSAMCPSVKKWIAICDDAGLPDYKTEVESYESFIANASDEIDWPRFDENTACTLCYTSGTTSPLGTTYSAMPDHDYPDYDSTVQHKLYAGRRIFGVDMRIVDDEGNVLPQDGEAEGHLHVRGPWISSGYFKGAGQDSFTDDGWFATGDVSVLHPSGYMEITDRSKDVIKSGGEWISSIEVENAASDHPDVVMAACIGVRHEKWQERPLLIVQAVDGKTPDIDEIKQCIKAKCAKWWMPDAIVFRDALPIGATGKILKRELKEIYKDFDLEKAS